MTLLHKVHELKQMNAMLDQNLFDIQKKAESSGHHEEEIVIERSSTTEQLCHLAGPE